MKKIILFILLSISLNSFSQTPYKLRGPINQIYLGDTTNYYFSADSFKIWTNKDFFIFNKPIKSPLFLQGNTDTLTTSKALRDTAEAIHNRTALAQKITTSDTSRWGEGSTTYASNGLTKDADTIKLGGSLANNVTITTNDNDFVVSCDSVLNTTNQYGSAVGINFDEGGSVSMGVTSDGSRRAYIVYDDDGNITSLTIKKDSIKAKGRIYSSGTTTSDTMWLTTRHYVDSVTTSSFTYKYSTDSIFFGASEIGFKDSIVGNFTHFESYTLLRGISNPSNGVNVNLYINDVLVNTINPVVQEYNNVTIIAHNYSDGDLFITVDSNAGDNLSTTFRVSKITWESPFEIKIEVGGSGGSSGTMLFNKIMYK